jgi:hypothetical protein
MQIVAAWWQDVSAALHGEPLRVSDLRSGVFYTAAQLTTGHVGVAFIYTA